MDWIINIFRFLALIVLHVEYHTLLFMPSLWLVYKSEQSESMKEQPNKHTSNWFPSPGNKAELTWHVH